MFWMNLRVYFSRIVNEVYSLGTCKLDFLSSAHQALLALKRTECLEKHSECLDKFTDWFKNKHQPMNNVWERRICVCVCIEYGCVDTKLIACVQDTIRCFELACVC